MKKAMQKVISILCAAGLLSALTYAAPAQNTVHVTFWDGRDIYVDGIPIGFRTDRGWDIHPLDCNGNIYIPIRTAGEWLGGTAVWDAEKHTVTLTRGQTPYYQNIYAPDRCIELEEDRAEATELRKLIFAEGIEAEQRPDVSVLLDGKVQTMVTAQGQVMYPLLLNGQVYLPVRSVAAMCGKQITWSPGSPQVMDFAATHSFSELYGDYQPVGSMPRINLYDAPTQAQLDAVQNYLQEVERRFWAVVDCVNQQSSAKKTLNSDELTQQIRLVEKSLDAMLELNTPDAPFFSWAGESLQAAVRDIKVFNLEGYLSGLSPEFVNGRGTVQGDKLGSLTFQGLYQLRGLLLSANDYFNRVKADCAVYSAGAGIY